SVTSRFRRRVRAEEYLRPIRIGGIITGLTSQPEPASPSLLPRSEVLPMVLRPIPATPCVRRLSLLITLLLPLGAQAQVSAASAAPTELDAVQVNAYRTTSHLSGATKTDTPLAETTQSVSVIAREELDARGVQNLNE